MGNVTGELINTHTIALTYEGHEITMEDVGHSEEIRENLMPHGLFYCMVEMPNLRNTSEETRRYPPHPNTRGVAVVYASPVGRMLGNVFLRLKGSMLPTRLFGTREQALQWL